MAEVVKSAGSTFELEPFTNQPISQCRTDLLVTGTAAPNRMANMIDFSILSPIASHGRRAYGRVIRDPAETLLSYTERMLQATLRARALAKTRKYGEICAQEFTPAVVTSGGTFHHQFGEWLAKIYSCGIAKGKVRRIIGMILLKARAVHYTS